jgi:hypothetical protein
MITFIAGLTSGVCFGAGVTLLVQHLRQFNRLMKEYRANNIPINFN